MTNIPVGYKQTEVGVIPNDWNMSPFSEISFMKGRIGWQGLKKDEFNMDSSLPFLITGMNFKDGKIRWDEVYHVSWERFEIAKEIQLKKDDVLMTKDGTIGKVLYVDDIPYPHKASLNSHLLLYRPLRNSYFPKFLYYQLDSFLFKKFIESNKSGSTLTGISQGEVGKYLVVLPTLSEQKKIATTLSNIDKLIESLDELIEKKKNIKKGTMQKLLKPDEGWIETSLEKVVKIQKGEQININLLDDNGLYQYLNGGVKASGYTNKYNSLGGITISEGGSCGYVSYINEKFWYGGHCYLLKMLNNYPINEKFMYQLLKFNENSLMSLGVGSGLQNIQKRTLEAFCISIPLSTEKQEKIAEILSDMDKDIEALEEKKSKYEQIKLGAMQQLLTGKIRLV